MEKPTFIQVNEAAGPTQAADLQLCRVIMDALGQAYPGYLWGVGVNHEAGVLKITLNVPQLLRKGMGEAGFLLHIATAIGPGGAKKVLSAAGEILERYRLPRERAPDDWMMRAKLGGYDGANMILKSKH